MKSLSREVVQRLHSPMGKLPRCYQVVIRAEFKQQVPMKICHVTHRILDSPWKSSRRVP